MIESQQWIPKAGASRLKNPRLRQILLGDICIFLESFLPWFGKEVEWFQLILVLIYCVLLSSGKSRFKINTSIKYYLGWKADNTNFLPFVCLHLILIQCNDPYISAIQQLISFLDIFSCNHLFATWSFYLLCSCTHSYIWNPGNALPFINLCRVRNTILARRRKSAENLRKICEDMKVCHKLQAVGWLNF